MYVAGPGKAGKIIGCGKHVFILQAAPKSHEVLIHVVAAPFGQFLELGDEI
jgi:hypothetical protein